MLYYIYSPPHMTWISLYLFYSIIKTFKVFVASIYTLNMQIWLSRQTYEIPVCYSIYLCMRTRFQFSFVSVIYCMYQSVCLLPYELETTLNLPCSGSGVWFSPKVPSIIIWHSHRRSVTCEVLLSRTFWSVTVLSVWGWQTLIPVGLIQHRWWSSLSAFALTDWKLDTSILLKRMSVPVSDSPSDIQLPEELIWSTNKKSHSKLILLRTLPWVYDGKHFYWRHASMWFQFKH